MKRAAEGMTPARGQSPQRVRPGALTHLPSVEQRTPDYRFEALPRELLHRIAGLLDLSSCRQLFGVSTRLNAALAGVEPSHPEFRWVNLCNLLERLGDYKSFDALEKRFFSIDFCADRDSIADLYERARKEGIDTIRLSGCQADLDEILKRLEREVQARGADSSCRLLLSPGPSRALEEATLKALKTLRITSLATADPAWVALTPCMPDLDELIFTGPDLATLLSSLALRTSPIAHLHVRVGEPGNAKVEQLAQLLQRLQVTQLTWQWKDNAWLADLGQCDLETLRVVDHISNERMASISDFLIESPITILILEGDDWSSETCELSYLASEVERHSRLTHLEVRLDCTRLTEQSELLTAVIANPNIRFASLPYPIEFQALVDRTLAACPWREIRRTNDYTGYARRLEEIVESLEQARSKAH